MAIPRVAVVVSGGMIVVGVVVAALLTSPTLERDLKDSKGLAVSLDSNQDRAREQEEREPEQPPELDVVPFVANSDAVDEGVRPDPGEYGAALHTPDQLPPHQKRDVLACSRFLGITWVDLYLDAKKSGKLEPLLEEWRESMRARRPKYKKLAQAREGAADDKYERGLFEELPGDTSARADGRPGFALPEASKSQYLGEWVRRSVRWDPVLKQPRLEVVRIGPGECPEVDSARSALRSEDEAIANRLRAILAR